MLRRRQLNKTEEMTRRRRLVDLFHRMDINQDRILTKDEVNLHLMGLGYDPAAIMGFWQTFDINRDRQITAEEFNAYLDMMPDDSVDADKLKRVFALFDQDDSGRIELVELKAIFTQLGNGTNDDLIKSVLALNGISPDGAIDFEHFVRIFSNPAYV